jgi:hypothetical protein
MLALGAKKYILKAEFRLDEIIDMIRELIQDNKDIEAEKKANAAGVPQGAPLTSALATDSLTLAAAIPAGPPPPAPTPGPDTSAMFPPQPPTQNSGV